MVIVFPCVTGVAAPVFAAASLTVKPRMGPQPPYLTRDKLIPDVTSVSPKGARP